MAAEKKQLLRLFNPESFAGGGEFFKDGLYRMEKAMFVWYDFNGKVPGKNGNGLVCLSIKLQPVNKDHKDEGEAVMQFWSLGTEDATIENKGKGVALTGEYTTIWKLSDYFVFVENYGKSGGDLDSLSEECDISFLEGKVVEFGKVDSPRDSSKSKKADDDDKPKKAPNKIPVIIDANPGKGSGAGAGKKDSGKKEDAKKEDSKKEDTKSSSNDEDEENESILQEYLVKKVLVKKNEDGIELIQARMGLNGFVQREKKGDTAKVKAVNKMWTDDLVGNAAEAAGWKLSGDTLKKE